MVVAISRYQLLVCCLGRFNPRASHLCSKSISICNLSSKKDRYLGYRFELAGTLVLLPAPRQKEIREEVELKSPHCLSYSLPRARVGVGQITSNRQFGHITNLAVKYHSSALQLLGKAPRSSFLALVTQRAARRFRSWVLLCYIMMQPKLGGIQSSIKL